MLVTIRTGDSPSEEVQTLDSALQVALEKAGHQIVDIHNGYEVIIFLGHSSEDIIFVPEIIEGLEFGGGFIIYHVDLYPHPEFFDLTEVDPESEVHNCTFAISNIEKIIERLAN
jgi:hypothetical protein